MAITFTKKNSGGVASLSRTGIGAEVIIGTAKGGTVNTIKEFITTNTNAVIDEYVEGDLMEHILETMNNGGTRVFAIKVPGSTAGVIYGVLKRVAGTSTGDCTLTGAAPEATYDVAVKIIKAGDVATATFQYSLDGGNTWSDVLLTSATVVITNTGLTLNFTGGAATAFTATDRYDVHVDGPLPSIAEVQTAIGLLSELYLIQGKRFEAVKIVGSVNKTFGTTFASEMATLVSDELILVSGVLDAEMPKAALELDGTNDKFSIVAPGAGDNVIASATDITPASTVGKTQAQITTDIETKINAVSAGPSANWAATVGADGNFKLDASGVAGVTSIIIAAPSAGNDATNQVFGNVADNDSVADTFTGSTPVFESASAHSIRMIAEWAGFGNEIQVNVGGFVVDTVRGQRKIMPLGPLAEGRVLSIDEHISFAKNDDGAYVSAVSIHPPDLNKSIQKTLVDALFVAPEKSRNGILIAKRDLLMKAAGNLLRFRAWQRIQNSMATEIIDEMDGLSNIEVDDKSLSEFEDRLNAPVRRRVSEGKLESAKLTIPDGQDFVSGVSIEVQLTWTPLGQVGDFGLTMTLIVPSPFV